MEYVPPKLNYSFPEGDVIRYPATSAVFVIHNIDDVVHPSLNCTWNFNDSAICELSFSLNFTYGDYNAYVQDFDPENPGMHRVSISCTNGLAWLNETRYILYGRKLENVTFTLEENTRIFPVNQPVTFAVSGVYGSFNTTYGFHWGDNHTGIQIMPEHMNFQVVYSYPTGGNFTPYVDILEDGNITTHWENETSYITIQEFIKDVQLHAYLDVESGPTTYNFSLFNSGPKIPSQIFCDWSCNGEPTVGVYYGDLEVNTNYSFQCDYGSIVGEVNVTANCSNLFSYQYFEKTVTTYVVLSDVTIHPITSTIVATGGTVIFQINATGGSHDNLYTLVFGDGVIYIERKGIHEDFNVSHIFSFVGNYTVSLLASDAWASFYMNVTDTVIVQNPITSLNLELTETLLAYPGTGEATLTANTGVTPTDVHCKVDFPDGQFSYSFASNFSVGKSVVVEGVLDSVLTFGDNLVEANCSNLISSQVANSTCYVQEKIQIAFAVNEKYAAVMDTVTYNVTMTAGSHVTMLTSNVTGLNVSEMDTTCYSESNYKCQLPLQYNAPGVYNFTMFAYNNVSSDDYSLQDAVTIRCPIKGVTVTGPEFVPYPSGIVSFLVLSNEMLCPPDGAKLLWEYDSSSINVTRIQNLTEGYTFEKTYSYEDVGFKNEQFLICNEVSNELVSTDLTIIELLNGTEFSVDHLLAEEHMTISFTGSTTNGSHLTYVIDYGDGDVETSVCDPNVNVRNQIHTFQHAYTDTGNYTVTLNVSNMYGFEVFQKYIHIANGIPELTLTSDGPILTPPGYISFTLNGTYEQVPNDVECLWELGDGYTQYSHTGNLTLPMTVSFQYQPTYETFTSALRTTVNCVNPVSNKTTEVVTVIEGNPIVMASLVDNGPVQPNEQITSTLIVEKRGYHACFVFTVDNSSYLFGAADCPSRFTGNYTSFEAVTNETGTLELNFTISTKGVYILVVKAFNNYQLVEIKDSILVLDEKCDPPVVGLGTIGRNIQTPKMSLKSQHSITRGSIEIICYHDFRYISSWVIRRVIDWENGIFENVTHIPNPSSPVLLVPARELDLGVYWVTLTVTMELLPILVKVTESAYLEIVPTPITVTLIGGSHRMMNYNEPKADFTVSKQ